jgi:hypothetical protein
MNKIVDKYKLQKGYSPTIFMKIVLVICILVYSIITLTNLFIGIFNGISQDILSSDILPSSFFFYKHKMLDIIQTNSNFFILMGLIGAGIVTGLVIMYRGFTTGYYIFVVAVVLNIILPIMFFGKSAIAVGDIMILVFLLIFFFVNIISHQNK